VTNQRPVWIGRRAADGVVAKVAAGGVVAAVLVALWFGVVCLLTKSLGWRLFAGIVIPGIVTCVGAATCWRRGHRWYAAGAAAGAVTAAAAMLFAWWVMNISSGIS
jgi:hypothetical protein